jgi:hypothetical protein
MRITQSQLKKIIKEELETVIQEQAGGEAWSLDTAADYVWVRPRPADAKDAMEKVAKIHKQKLESRARYGLPVEEGDLPRGYWAQNNGNIFLVVVRGELENPTFLPLANYIDQRDREYQGDLNSNALHKKIVSMLNAAGFKEDKANLRVPMSAANLRAMGIEV